MLPEHPNASLPDDLDDLAIAVTIIGAIGRASLATVEATFGPLEVQTPNGGVWMAATRAADDMEIRVFSDPRLVEIVTAACPASEVEESSGRRVSARGFRLIEGVFVTAISPYGPAFRAAGPGANFLRTQPDESDWLKLPIGWSSALSRLLAVAEVRPSNVEPLVEGASHALH